MGKKVVGVAKYFLLSVFLSFCVAKIMAATREADLIDLCQGQNCDASGRSCLPIKAIDCFDGMSSQFLALNTATSAPAYDTVASTDGKLTVIYPPSVSQGEKFNNKVTIKGYGRLYEYFVDETRTEVVWPVRDKNKTLVHAHVFGAEEQHNFRVELLYCKDPERAECGHNRVTSSVS